MYRLKIYCFAVMLCLLANAVQAQLTISGTVFDISKTIPVRGVTVKSSAGWTSVTDSSGHYDIVSTDKDSLTFIYQGKPTARFAVKQIANIGNFDISLHITVTEKFRTLKEVKVFSRSYKQDSVANRDEYTKIFNYQKPGIQINSSDYSGAVGLDLDEFINIFRFKRNHRLQRLQSRLLEQEQENYINYRFNKTLVERVTRLEGIQLDSFMVRYRPDFDFTRNSSTVNFYQYILNASYQFKRQILIAEGKKESP